MASQWTKNHFFAIFRAIMRARHGSSVRLLPKRAANWLPVIILWAIVAPVDPARSASVTLLESSGKVLVQGKSSATAKLERTFRLAQNGSSTPLALSFLPSDLVSDDGQTVDRSKVLVREPAALGINPQDYHLEVTGLTHPGKYTGEIEVRAASGNLLLNIPVEVLATRTDGLALAPETPRLRLKLARRCHDGLTRFVLGDSFCPREFALALDGAQGTGGTPEVDVLLVYPDGAASQIAKEGNTGIPGITPNGDAKKLTLKIDDGALAPGHYSGRIRALFDGGATLIEGPIDIDVRTSAWLPLLAIAFGVLAGQWQAYMQRVGTALATAAERLRNIAARADQLDDDAKAALTDTSREAWQAIALGEAQRAAEILASEERCLSALEALQRLRSRFQFDDDTKKLAKDILDHAALNNADACATALGSLQAALTQPAPTSARAMQAASRLAAARAATAAGAKRAKKLASSFWTFAVTRVSRPLLQVVLVVSLSLAGLYTLYVSNGLTMGAQPLADFLTLFAWGLTADVASRTLATFRGVTPIG